MMLTSPVNIFIIKVSLMVSLSQYVTVLNLGLISVSIAVTLKINYNGYISHDMRFLLMWHFDMCRLRRACAAFFLAKKLQMLFTQ